MLSDSDRQAPCTIVIMGASGDLCRRKLMPALFSLFSLDMLPRDFRIIGFARTSLTDDAFRELIAKGLECRYRREDCTDCEGHKSEFLSRCHYFTGQYDDPESFRALGTMLRESQGEGGNRLFYMSIPPSVFTETADSLGQSGIMDVAPGRWARVVLEKPFGRDSESSLELAKALAGVFTDEQVFRIDHYLGKEVIQNLLILRFANLIFEPLWNRNYIKYVSISFSEQLGLEGRAGYFDRFGIIRDVMQNHLMQILALVAMEQPVGLAADHITNEKAKVLRCVQPLGLDDVILGQYAGGVSDGKPHIGYAEEPGVPQGSVTETYAHATLRINNPRWYGVPFYLGAGKALDTRKTEIHVQFADMPYSLFTNFRGCECADDLHIRVQPDEAIELHLASKVPGLAMDLGLVKLNMLYKDTFKQVLPEAYERLLLDVIRGDHSLFIREEELQASWDVFTPVLHEMENRRIRPELYPFGSKGPEHGLPV